MEPFNGKNFFNVFYELSAPAGYQVVSHYPRNGSQVQPERPAVEVEI